MTRCGKITTINTLTLAEANGSQTWLTWPSLTLTFFDVRITKYEINK